MNTEAHRIVIELGQRKEQLAQLPMHHELPTYKYAGIA